MQRPRVFDAVDPQLEARGIETEVEATEVHRDPLRAPGEHTSAVGIGDDDSLIGTIERLRRESDDERVPIFEGRRGRCRDRSEEDAENEEITYSRVHGRTSR